MYTNISWVKNININEIVRGMVQTFPRNMQMEGGEAEQ
jgi:hypothetical protein